jgi:hypothetical protein
MSSSREAEPSVKLARQPLFEGQIGTQAGAPTFVPRASGWRDQKKGGGEDYLRQLSAWKNQATIIGGRKYPIYIPRIV